MANLVATGTGTINWYATATATTALDSAMPLVAGNYFASQTIAGCESVSRTSVAVTIDAIDGIITQVAGILTVAQSGATYQWFTCPNTILVDATNQTFTPTVAGDYKVAITFNGCEIISNCVTVSTLNKTAFDSANFSYYPNPTTGILNVNYSSEINSVQIINVLGQEVLSKKINGNEGQIDMQSLPNGTYLAKVTAAEKVKTVKVVKQ